MSQNEIENKNIDSEMLVRELKLILHFFTYDKIFGNFLVGTDVTTCPHTNVPIPKKIHQSH